MKMFIENKRSFSNVESNSFCKLEKVAIVYNFKIVVFQVIAASGWHLFEVEFVQFVLMTIKINGMLGEI